MLALWHLWQSSQAPACGGDETGECACHLPLGPHVDADGIASEVEFVPSVGHRWHMLPYCVMCGGRFAEPRRGRVCCVCLGRMHGKCNDCGRLLQEPAANGVCAACLDFAALITNSDSSEVYSRILARRKAKQNQQLVK